MSHQNLRTFVHQLLNGFNIIFVSNNCRSITTRFMIHAINFSNELHKTANSCSKMFIGYKDICKFLKKILICILPLVIVDVTLEVSINPLSSDVAGMCISLNLSTKSYYKFFILITSISLIKYCL